MGKITITKGDITTQRVDAIVNAANRILRGGGGVDGAIHDAAGPELYEECITLSGCEVGQAKITRGYRLPAQYVIHTVGPEYGYTQGRDAEFLRSCYETTLALARERGLKTIAFPAISVGVFHYPLQEATKIAVETVRKVLKADDEAFEEIRFVAFTQEVYDAYLHELHTGFHPLQTALEKYKNLGGINGNSKGEPWN